MISFPRNLRVTRDPPLFPLGAFREDETYTVKGILVGGVIEGE